MKGSSLKDNIGFIAHGVRNLTPAEAYSACRKGAILVDLRKDYLRAYKQFGVDNVYYTDANRIADLVSQYSYDEVIILAETSGSGKTVEIVKKLINEGFTNVFNLAGGFVEWERDGLPITEDKNERLSGSCMCQLRPRKKRK